MSLGRTFGDVARGQPVAYLGSAGYLEVAVNGASAEAILGLGEGDIVTIRPGKPPSARSRR